MTTSSPDSGSDRPSALRDCVSERLTRLARLDVHLLGWRCHAFHLCGSVGVTCGVVLSLLVVSASGQSVAAMALIALSAIVTFLALAAATLVWTGTERLVFLHQELAVFSVAATVAALLGEPVLPYLDGAALGLGAVLAFGRIGCLMVGCCHGRPHQVGVCYGSEHGDAGLTREYVGVRLFPVQALEAIWVLGTVTVGCALVLANQPAGSALTWYVAVHCAGRFAFEYARGDIERPYWGWFSEAQWIATTCILAVVLGGTLGVLPVRPWHAAVAVALLAGMLATVGHDRWRGPLRSASLRAGHVQELVAALRLALAETPRVVSTSLGVQISGGAARSGSRELTHVTLSCRTGDMGEGLARDLSSRLLPVIAARSRARPVAGTPGIFHLVVQAEAETGPGEDRAGAAAVPPAGEHASPARPVRELVCPDAE